MAVSQHVLQRTEGASLDARAFFVHQGSQIRGLCILGVVVIHVTGIVALTTTANWLKVALLYSNSVARFAVPLFVMLSAFHLSLSSRNERAWSLYRRAVKGLLIPYIVYSTFYIGIGHPIDATFLRAWLQGVLTASGYGHLWFIPVIFELYLLHPFLRRWYRQQEHAELIVLTALVVQVCATVAVQLLQPAIAGATWRRATAILFLPHIGSFLAGYYLLDHAQGIAERIARRSVLWVACSSWLGLSVLMVIGWFAWEQTGSFRDRLLYRDLPLAVVGPLFAAAALAVFAGMDWTERGVVSGAMARMVRTCGFYAYGIYYVHPLILLAVSWVLTDIIGLSWQEALFYVVAFIAVTLLSLLFVKSLVRFPLTRYLA